MLRKLSRFLTVPALAIFMSGCVSTVLNVADNANLNVADKAGQPLKASLVSELTRRKMTPADPILIRIFKDESELEIWKRDRAGRYALLKTFPMCRWSGKLGPKTKNGDRQAPEGFYQVSAGMLNPSSQYYLSFNLGYPNKLESALGYSGEALMVHGACSSSGCFALTDAGVAEIYAIVREAIKGGQTSFQVQAFPFRMTPENMAKNRNDPNFGFWTNLKQGYDSFEVTGRPPKVSYCGRRYVFDADFEGGDPRDPLAPCPPLSNPLNGSVVARGEADARKTEAILAAGTNITAHAYADGGMNVSFRKLLKNRGAAALAKQTSLDDVPISRPEAALADPHSAEE